MAVVLTNLGANFFTHIFVDEAGQALESEAVMALSLANDKTCIVLAGDHLQTSNKVYSSIAREQKLDRSLLERLFDYYEQQVDLAKFTNTMLRISLTVNYRSKTEILRFISSVFYGDPNRLEAKNKEPPCAAVPALTFYTNRGREAQDKENTSPHNWAEANEVLTRVKELYDNWPEDLWDERDARQICVVTPYAAQVSW